MSRCNRERSERKMERLVQAGSESVARLNTRHDSLKNESGWTLAARNRSVDRLDEAKVKGNVITSNERPLEELYISASTSPHTLKRK